MTAAPRPSLLRRLYTRLALAFFRVPRDAIRFGFRRFGPRVAIAAQGRQVTFSQLEERVGRLVGALAARGVGKGAVVFAALEDGTEMLELRFAALEAGVVQTGVAPWSLPAHVEMAARLGQPAFLFFDHRLSPSLKAALERLPLPADRRVETGPAWEAFLASAAPLRSSQRLSPSDVAAIGYSSGTTGEPKVLQAPQGALMKSLRLTATNVRAPVGQRDVMMSAIPLNGAGSGLVLPMALTGATLAIPPSRSPAALVEALANFKVTRAFMTPSQLLDLLDEDGFSRQALPHLRNIIYGTAIMPVPRLEEALLRMGPIFQQGYGMAEVLPPVSLLQMEQHVGPDGRPAPRDVLRSVGWLVPEVKVRIVDARLEDLPFGQVGEVLIDSPTVFEGYWRLEGPDRSVFHQGYLRSGDYGSLTADGRLTVLDRRADLLRRHGEVLFPRLLEEAAFLDPTVKEACVVQVAPEAPVVLMVSPRKGRVVALETLRQCCAADPLGQKIEEFRVLDELPRSPLQKLLRREVRALAVASPLPSKAVPSTDL